MAIFLNNLFGGIKYRIGKTFHRPYSIFDIGWFEEKQLKHREDAEIKYHLYRGRYKIAFRDAPEFLVSIDELFIKEFYKFKPDNDCPRIIDCGSYIGTSILYFKLNYPNSVITGFEPDPVNYSLLSSNLENWAFPDVKIHPSAVWINNEGISFSSAGNMSSKIEIREDKGNDSVKVSTIRLRELLNEEIDFLKIDIEGAELPVLIDCEEKLNKVKNLFIEYHGRFEKTNELNEILDLLVRNNFTYCIKEGIGIHLKPFWDKDVNFQYDMLLNIFAFRA